MRARDTHESFRRFEEIFDEAANHAGDYDPLEVQRYAESLSGLAGQGAREVLDRLADMPFPAGFVFARFFDATTGKYFGGALKQTFEPVETRNLITQLVPCRQFEQALGFAPKVWVRTTAMPFTKLGVLDLAIEYQMVS